MARKNGVLTQINDLWLKAAPKDAKRDVGQQVNELKRRVEQAIEAAQQGPKNAGASSRLETDRLDITLPGIQRPIGAEHPVVKTMNEIVSVFQQPRLLGAGRSGDRDRLLQFRGAEFSA